jgi:hypothetical protein
MLSSLVAMRNMFGRHCAKEKVGRGGGAGQVIASCFRLSMDPTEMAPDLTMGDHQFLPSTQVDMWASTVSSRTAAHSWATRDLVLLSIPTPPPARPAPDQIGEPVICQEKPGSLIVKRFGSRLTWRQITATVSPSTRLYIPIFRVNVTYLAFEVIGMQRVKSAIKGSRVCYIHRLASSTEYLV